MADGATVAAQAAIAQISVADPMKAVGEQSPRVKELERLRELPRALVGGTEEMRKAGIKYCPKHEAETKDAYDMRIKSTILYGGFSQTVKAQSAKLFTREVVLNEDVPPALQDMAEDIDGQGTSLTAFFFNCMMDGFTDGVSYFMVDFPRMTSESGVATYADQKAIGARPYFVAVCASQILGWKTAYKNGRTYLSQVRIREEGWVDDGDFGQKCEKRVRVVEEGLHSVYREVTTINGAKTFELIPELSGTVTWPGISVIPIYTNQSGFFEGKPPLRELAEMNQEHWVSSSEQRRALSYLRFAMLMVRGIEVNDKVEIGPSKVLKLTNPQADAKYVEHTGAGIEAGAKDLEAIEKRMHAAGMELRIENVGKLTATAAAIDSAESNAGLKAIAKGLESAIESGLMYAAQMLQLASGGQVEVYDEFAEEKPPGEVADLTKLYTTGLIARETVWSELVRRHVLDSTFDPEAEAKLIDAGMPSLLGGPLAIGKTTPPQGNEAPPQDGGKPTPQPTTKGTQQ